MSDETKKPETPKDAAPAMAPAPAPAVPVMKAVTIKNGAPLIGRTYRALLSVLIAFACVMPFGCEAVKALADNVQICVEYKGRHICVGREGGKWTFNADLSPEEQDEITAALGK